MALLNAVLPRLDEARLPDSNWCRFGGDTDNIDSPSNLRLLGGVHLKPASPSTSSTDRSRVAAESISEATPVSISASHTSAARSRTLIGEPSLPSRVGFLGENSDAVPSLSVPSPATPLANVATTAVVSTQGVSTAAVVSTQGVSSVRHLYLLEAQLFPWEDRSGRSALTRSRHVGRTGRLCDRRRARESRNGSSPPSVRWRCHTEEINDVLTNVSAYLLLVAVSRLCFVSLRRRSIRKFVRRHVSRNVLKRSRQALAVAVAPPPILAADCLTQRPRNPFIHATARGAVERI